MQLASIVSIFIQHKAYQVLYILACYYNEQLRFLSITNAAVDKTQ